MYTLYINILGATSVNITDTPEISTTLAVGLVIGVDVHDTGRNLNFIFNRNVIDTKKCKYIPFEPSY